MILKAKVPPQYDNFTLLDYLSSRFTYLPKEEWKIRIAEKKHSLNGVILDEDFIVHSQDLLCYNIPDEYLDELDANFDYKILIETKDFLVIDKPPNLMMHKHKTNIRNNLIYHLREMRTPNFPQANLVNRLDKNTSGIVLAALNRNARRKLALQFANRTVRKTYFAVVIGTPSPLSGIITEPIGKIVEPNKADLKDGRFCGVGFDNTKESITKYETILSTNGHSLVKVFPVTGRTHQIRIHLSHIGTPIVADPAYGLHQEQYFDYCTYHNIKPMTATRQLLHCSELEFSYGAAKIRAVSPVPADFIIQ